MKLPGKDRRDRSIGCRSGNEHLGNGNLQSQTGGKIKKGKKKKKIFEIQVFSFCVSMSECRRS